MKALTIWQPWASLIIAGAKPYEFRGWPVPRWMIGQRLVIHAGSRVMRRAEIEDLQQRLFDPEQAEQAWTTGLHADRAEPVLRRAWLQSAPNAKQRGFFDGLGEPYEPLPMAAGIGTTVLSASLNGWDACETFGHRVNDSDRDAHANFAWPLHQVEAWDHPVAAKGAQGFWNWPSAEAFASAL